MVDKSTLGLIEIGWDDVNRIIVAQDREKLLTVVNKVMSFRIE
jgi:hypothetical protein